LVEAEQQHDHGGDKDGNQSTEIADAGVWQNERQDQRECGQGQRGQVNGFQLEQELYRASDAARRIAPGHDRQLVQDEEYRNAAEKACGDRVGDEANEPPKPKQSRGELKESDQDDHGEEPVRSGFSLQIAERLRRRERGRRHGGDDHQLGAGEDTPHSRPDDCSIEAMDGAHPQKGAVRHSVGYIADRTAQSRYSIAAQRHTPWKADPCPVVDGVPERVETWQVGFRLWPGCIIRRGWRSFHDPDIPLARRAVPGRYRPEAV
jgi:hypothetical protein